MLFFRPRRRLLLPCSWLLRPAPSTSSAPICPPLRALSSLTATLKILNLPDDAFKVDQGDINIGISVRKGNTELKDKINSALAGMTEDDFNRIMDEAAKIQPLSK